MMPDNVPQPQETRPSQREDKRLAARRRILCAATEIFAARGYEGSTLPAIATACGLRVSLILYHFGSKEALWRAVVTDVFSAVEAQLDREAGKLKGLSGLPYFKQAVRVHIEAAASNPNYHRILFHEGMQDTPRLTFILDSHQRAMSFRITSIIEEAQGEGLLPKTLSSMHLKFITSGMFTLPMTLAPEYRMLAEEDPLEDDFIEKHIEACLAILTGDTGRLS